MRYSRRIWSGKKQNLYGMFFEPIPHLPVPQPQQRPTTSDPRSPHPQDPMSFHWNLSSDDDDEDDNEDIQQNINGSPPNCREAHLITTTHVLHAKQPHDWGRNADVPRTEDAFDNNNTKDDDDNDDDVDWEDADDFGCDDDGDDDRKPAAMECMTPTAPGSVVVQPITIDLNQPVAMTGSQNDNGVTSKKRKRRNVFRIESLPNTMQSLLRNIHHTHLLSLTGHAVYLSSLYSDPEIMTLAYSLIPDNWDILQQQQEQQQRNHCPSLQQMSQFVNEWYIPFVHDIDERRRQQQYLNRRAGAPIISRRSRRQGSRVYHKGQPSSKSNVDHVVSDTHIHNPDALLRSFILYLSKTADDDPQLTAESKIPSMLQNPQTSDEIRTGLLIAMVRSLGWRARLVGAIEPISVDLTVNHPILTSFRNNIFTSVPSPTKKSKKSQRQPDDRESNNGTATLADHSIGMFWVEILCVDHHNNSTQNPYRWFHVDPVRKLINQPGTVEGVLGQRLQHQQRHVLAYAVSIEHSPMCTSNISTSQQQQQIPRLRLTDVTPRYAQSWIASLRKRGTIRSKNCSIEEVIRNSWWTKTLRTINIKHRPSIDVGNMPATSNGSSEHPIPLQESRLDDHENDELVQAANNEAIPTSKAEFKTHPMYVIPSEMGKTEALHPDAKQRVCGVFKGQLVYRRSDVSTIYTAKKWLYTGRKVRDNEVARPIKTQTKRKKPLAKGFKALRSYCVGETNDGNEQRQIEHGSIPLNGTDDDTDKLYGIWQTDAWSPDYIGPNDDIPTNEFRNIELALLNPGLVHIDQTGLAGVAKKLGIPYAPCLLGFEGHGGNRTPTVRGIVVHEHNAQLIREAGVEVQSFQAEQECNDRRRFLLLQWKRLMVGLLTKDRLDREYGNEKE